jgi:hypothetical protein
MHHHPPPPLRRYIYGFGACDAPPGNGTSVTQCLPAGVVSSVVRWALAVTLVLGYPVILFPVHTTLEGWWLRGGRGRDRDCEAVRSRGVGASGGGFGGDDGRRRGAENSPCAKGGGDSSGVGHGYTALAAGGEDKDEEGHEGQSNRASDGGGGGGGGSVRNSRTGRTRRRRAGDVPLQDPCQQGDDLHGHHQLRRAEDEADSSRIDAHHAAAAAAPAAPTVAPTAAPAGQPLPRHYYRLKQAAIRVGAVACTCLVASLFEDISIFSSLVGALLVTAAGFVLPPLVHWSLMRDAARATTHTTTTRLALAGDVALIVFGLVACAMGTTSAVQDIVAAATTKR